MCHQFSQSGGSGSRSQPFWKSGPPSYIYRFEVKHSEVNVQLSLSIRIQSELIFEMNWLNRSVFSCKKILLFFSG